MAPTLLMVSLQKERESHEYVFFEFPGACVSIPDNGLPWDKIERNGKRTGSPHPGILDNEKMTSLDYQYAIWVKLRGVLPIMRKALFASSGDRNG
jgi:hypothetical protein